MLLILPNYYLKNNKQTNKTLSTQRDSRRAYNANLQLKHNVHMILYLIKTEKIRSKEDQIRIKTKKIKCKLIKGINLYVSKKWVR